MVEAYANFAGKVGRTFASSEPSWPVKNAATDKKRNVIVMLVDDLGFSDLGCYGSEISTPEIDRLATAGLRYSNFHATSLCSPTRAALLTGKNPHAVGVGMVSNIDPGFPGYASELAENQPSMAESFRAAGYSTMMLGKWHLCRDSDMHAAADKSSWPLQRGFDEFYGFLEALTNLHHPHRLFEGNSVVEVDEYPEGYYLTDDLTDRAERMIRSHRASDPDKPFFMYFAHAAVHAPLHAKPSDIARQRGRYDQGWDVLRQERFARMKSLKIIDSSVELPPRNHETSLHVDAWNSLPDHERVVMSRYMEIYAAMVETIDRSVGRLRETLEALDEWDNTVFVFTSDNGASREGYDKGSARYHKRVTPTVDSSQVTDFDITAVAAGEVGGPTSWPHYPRGWAMACNTPFRLYKISTYRGGHTVPLIIRAPERITTAGSIVPAYTHVTDVLPTLAEVVDIPLLDRRHDLPAASLDGVSFAATFTDTEAESEHHEQYYECNGNRGYYRRGWEAVTAREPLSPLAAYPTRTGLIPLSEEPWQLFHVNDDPTQVVDLASSHPQVLDELKSAWEKAAWANQVFPINEGAGLNHLRRPLGDERFAKDLRLFPGTPTLERLRASSLISNRSFRIEVDVEFRHGDQGVLLAHGGQDAGYVLYVLDGGLCFAHNDYGDLRESRSVLLEPGRLRVSLAVTFEAPRRWSVRVCIDDSLQAEMSVGALGGQIPFEGIDIGIDRRSPVHWGLYQRYGAFPFTGGIHSATYRAEPRSREAHEDLLEQARVVGLTLE